MCNTLEDICVLTKFAFLRFQLLYFPRVEFFLSSRCTWRTKILCSIPFNRKVDLLTLPQKHLRLSLYGNILILKINFPNTQTTICVSKLKLGNYKLADFSMFPYFPQIWDRKKNCIYFVRNLFICTKSMSIVSNKTLSLPNKMLASNFTWPVFCVHSDTFQPFVASNF